ncbi:hypothetical protein A4E84_15060 [Streptomyces qaidamensis]|uniref:Lipocalin-like domain-containing protein n=1 Tax=Streptomyces qaidamensis TaxID=1783515 RepID=A0A143C0H5_9ACTN|nr:hypothetical protein [Streptomyces qaidamensis]AMW10710.1 hypothetical protein A4E84_15060 [Streptomyces qaidamensis]
MAVTGAVRSSLLLVTLLVGVTACASRGEPPGPGPTSRTASPNPAPSTTHADPPEQALPQALVGTWQSDSKDSDAGLTYRFRADGGYTFTGVLAYDSPDGIVQVTHASEGTARVRGAQLVLTPRKAETSRRDPGDPEGDYSARPAARTPQRHTWEVTGDALALTDQKGLTVTYERRSP